MSFKKVIVGAGKPFLLSTIKNHQKIVNLAWQICHLGGDTHYNSRVALVWASDWTGWAWASKTELEPASNVAEMAALSMNENLPGKPYFSTRNCFGSWTPACNCTSPLTSV